MNDASNVAIATLGSHYEADAAVKRLVKDGFSGAKLSVVGRGFHTEDKVLGFYNMGDRIKMWGSRGAVWGGLWGLLLGGLFIWTPVGPVMLLGYLGAVAATVVEGAVVGGGISVLFAAISSIGVSKDSVVRYESAVKADAFLVMVHGTAEEVDRARTILSTTAKSVDIHNDLATRRTNTVLA